MPLLCFYSLTTTVNVAASENRKSRKLSNSEMLNELEITFQY